MELVLGGAESGVVTGVDPLGSCSGVRKQYYKYFNATIAIPDRTSGQLDSRGFSIFSFKHSFIDRASVWRININFNICSIELKWDGKITKIWYDNEMRWIRITNGVKWRRFIVPRKVEQINNYLFIDTYKSNKIKIGVNDMTVNDSEMCVRWKDEALSIPEISVLR